MRSQRWYYVTRELYFNNEKKNILFEKKDSILYKKDFILDKEKKDDLQLFCLKKYRRFELFYFFYLFLFIQQQKNKFLSQKEQLFLTWYNFVNNYYIY